MRASSRVLKHSLQNSITNSWYLEEAGKGRLHTKHGMKQIVTVKTLTKHGSLRGFIICITDESLVMSRVKIGVLRNKHTARTAL